MHKKETLYKVSKHRGTFVVAVENEKMSVFITERAQDFQVVLAHQSLQQEMQEI